VQEFNLLVWYKLDPVAVSQLGSMEKANSFFLRFALSSIRAHPFLYLRHAAAHFYGMWRDLDRVPPLRIATMYVRRGSTQISHPAYGWIRNDIPANVIAPIPSKIVMEGEVINQSSLPLMFRTIWTAYWISSAWTTALGALAVLLSILVLVPGRLAYLYRTEIMIALSLNAYIGAHVLLQVSHPRYASMASVAAIFLAASFVFTSAYALTSLAAWAYKSTTSGGGTAAQK
jgi:hypothetical protein